MTPATPDPSTAEVSVQDPAPLQSGGRSIAIPGSVGSPPLGYRAGTSLSRGKRTRRDHRATGPVAKSPPPSRRRQSWWLSRPAGLQPVPGRRAPAPGLPALFIDSPPSSLMMPHPPSNLRRRLQTPPLPALGLRRIPPCPHPDVRRRYRHRDRIRFFPAHCPPRRRPLMQPAQPLSAHPIPYSPIIHFPSRKWR
jgi:hypothetical protein